MPKLAVFNLVTLDGYIAGKDGDISWHNVDAEFQEYAERASHSGTILLFGRITYDLMAGYWPTPEALKSDPIVARGMNAASKVVFSRRLTRATWANTRLVRSDPVDEVTRLKREAGPDMTILGSGSIVARLTQAGLIDEYQLLLNPVILGGGKTMFEGVSGGPILTLLDVRTFSNGNVLMRYAPRP
jgi:dihydrofolate reductase